ncbi:MAG: hypothetical protein BLM47_01945 [Candidatus Reconcilbacillus cellulovorans]|uniref:Uncharacterized protein n=1 Tax=Candidatus Reconcilbacillus cellulovorans TaxID=1906605 RepID=A0A2A6E470_9BACL|nr:MAG: hypothetical protein BLM47_01945 [Candidatus Reconcilbacillus cellulovorans]
MNNLDRLKMEIKGINFADDELSIFLEEVGLEPAETYLPTQNRRQICEAALHVLESIANQPHLMRAYKLDDMTVSEFAEHLQSRIDQLRAMLRTATASMQEYYNRMFMLFGGSDK